MLRNNSVSNAHICIIVSLSIACKIEFLPKAMKASNILSFNFQMDFESIYLANFKLKVSLLDGPTQLQQNNKQKNLSNTST